MEEYLYHKLKYKVKVFCKLIYVNSIIHNARSEMIKWDTAWFTYSKKYFQD